ncbi:PD-(D/E)XK nuclease family protein [Croceivirga sp. JEA036]|uniref:PD-(D/E)XK nuclease family protein n=1 Tax=Croceivirga sp. JEA036 TaxID=2721162 RepID=UPI00143C2349|nr:PD-(D/E)XK nuclease family protein [Croceivirga sp. JEA036]NJB36978.1 PD-(D/E)XK nuclease family protein [Croceivirga sp. JEA036]
MKSFLEETLIQLLKDHKNLNQMVFVLPSRRAGTYLKHYLAQQIEKPILSPQIYSIEEFIQEISGLEHSTNLEILLLLFEVYQKQHPEEKLEQFLQWGTTLLGDFNEIDRHLVDAQVLFDYLTAIERMAKWDLKLEPTKLIKNHTLFLETIGQLYPNYLELLRSENTGYQGLIYKKAQQNVEEYLENHREKSYHFIGFNALNEAEIKLIKAFISKTNNKIYWDIDSYFYEDPQHDVGYFIRNHFKKWKELPTKEHYFSNNYNAENKEVNIYGIPKNVTQAKFIGNLLANLYQRKTKKDTVALVLADETLLPAIINSLPENIPEVNITMGLPLEKTNLHQFISAYFQLFLNKSARGVFYKDVLQFLGNPMTEIVLQKEGIHKAIVITQHIQHHNVLFIHPDNLQFLKGTGTILHQLFASTELTTQNFIDLLLLLLNTISDYFENQKNHYEVQATQAFIKLFLKLKNLGLEKTYISSIKSLNALYLELISTEQLDFKGSPTSGLQIMGMLESRCLDFETVLMTSVNEGILPAGKSNNSFIPYDVKKEYKMPTYKEKDAIYTYHFYRLLQRASQVYVTYNTEPDVLLGNEKSRFIAQLLTDDQLKFQVKHHIATPAITTLSSPPVTVKKTDRLLNDLKSIASKGFSPSSLSNYIKNTYTFYKQNVLRINDIDSVEEQLAYNTFGTIVHNALEQLYLPYLNTQLTPELLKSLLPKIKTEVQQQFLTIYDVGDFSSGQNLIAFNVVQKYIADFIALDIKRCTENTVYLLGLEAQMFCPLTIPDLNFPIHLKGTLDRIDEVNGVLEIIDYKTGNVNNSEVQMVSKEGELAFTPKNLKAFQLLCYAYMYQQEHSIGTFKAGIVPIKQIQQAIIYFGTKTHSRGRANTEISPDLLAKFENELHQLIKAIFNAEIPFLDEEIT